MDIEGYECKAIVGAETVLRKSKPNLILSVHPSAIERLGYEKKGMFYLLESIYENIYFLSDSKKVEYLLYSKYLTTYDPTELPKDNFTIICSRQKLL